MQWVVDTGPILHLAEAQALDSLRLLGNVVLPPEVAEEFARVQPDTALPPWLRVEALDEIHRKHADDWCLSGLIDRGEAHAIALARQKKADIFLTDDAAARLFATSLGLSARGSLGVILWLAGQRQIEPAEACLQLDRLAETSLWVSPRVLAEAHAALKKLTK